MQVLRDGLNRVIVPPVHRRTLVWIHGFGDTAELFCEDFFQYPLIPDCKVVLPTAEARPVPCRDNMVTTAWYTNLGDSFPDDSIEPSVQRINSILLEESKYTDTLLIGGFSQGAVLSLLCGLCRYEGNISGIIALSGFAMDYPVLESKKNTPVLLYHGAQDSIIPLSRAQSSFQRNLQGVNLTQEVHPTMPHEVYSEEYEYIKTWVKLKLNY